jgi:hypothetical protein
MVQQVMLPTVLILSLTLATMTQLQDLAQEASDKAVKAADDQVNALDCAYTARPLTECSPDLFSEDYKAETAQAQAILADLRAQQYGELEARQRDRANARK